MLIQKDRTKGTVARNYRPIACLPLMCKLLIGILAKNLYGHFQGNGAVFMDEKKGCWKRLRGTKDQLLIDKVVLREPEEKVFGNRKAYGMVPHSWTVEMLGDR